MRARIEDGVVYSPFPAAEIPCCSFYEAAKEALFKDPDKLALTDGAVAVACRELFVRMQRYAAGFQKHGVKPGDRVCVAIGNSVDSFAAMWGCVFTGASVVLASMSYTERELRYRLNDSDSTHILTEPAYADITTKAAAPLKLKAFFATGPVEGFVSTAAFQDLDEAAFREVPIQDPRNCVLCTCYTSGTTGLPKGAVITHYSFLANLATARPCLCWEESDVVLVASSLSHASGFLFVTTGILLGAAVVMAPAGVKFERVRQLVSKYKVTTLSILSGHFGLLVDEMHRTGHRLPGVRRINLCGSAFPQAARKTVQAMFRDLEWIVDMYAMTESMAVLCSTSVHAAAGTDVGFPAACSQIKVVDVVTRQNLGPNHTGEICFRAPTVLKEYYKRPKETAEIFDNEGWCKTGDAGYYDEDGRLFIVQRLKEMIKCIDNQVNPAEIEELILQEHWEQISEVAVVGLPHPMYGQSPAAAVVLRDHSGNKYDPANLAKRIKATIADNLAMHKNLHGGVFYFDSLPKTESGKLSRSAVVQACAGRSAY
ncbi:uncharacterized protein LOC144097343 isoform X1 [Amblyomma americanum]